LGDGRIGPWAAAAKDHNSTAADTALVLCGLTAATAAPAS